jgi:flagellar basal-body rod modification protein FlgD
MLQTATIQATSNQGTSLQSATNKALGQEAFLHLLIAQLRNQDPLNPVDNTEMISQLAQFSQLEQTKQMTDALSSFVEQQNNANATNLVTLLGRQVTATGSSVSLTAGTPPSLSYQLAANASKVTVQVLNGAGAPVRTYALLNQNAGNQSIAWDGKDSSGNRLPPGIYSFAVTATAANGTPVTAQTTNTGTVSGIQFNSSGPMVVLESGQAVSPTQIVSVQ